MTRLASSLFVFLVAFSSALPGEPPASPTAQEIPPHERVRAEVEGALQDIRTSGDFFTTTQRLLALGADVAPFMLAELEAPSWQTFHVACYVLAHLRSPGAEEALRKAIERADREGEEFGRQRKAWACYALAILGEPEAVDLLNAGNLKTARVRLMADLFILEAVSVLTAPESVPRLLAQLETYSADPELAPELEFTLEALRRVADPSTRPGIVPFIKHPQPKVRRSAVRALGRLGDPAAADALLEALDDSLEWVRNAAAWEIEALKPELKIPQLVARLQVEESTAIRTPLYHTLAGLGRESFLETFQSQWGRRDPIDRIELVKAVGQLGSRKGLNLLRAAVRDTEPRVGIQALVSLARIDGPGATDTLLAIVQGGSWHQALPAMGFLADMEERRAAPRVAERLLQEVAIPVTEIPARARIEKMTQVLADLAYWEPLPALRKAADIQVDTVIRGHLEALIQRLGALAEWKEDPRKVMEALESADPDLRLLAYERVVDFGGAPAARALVAAFDRVKGREKIEVVRALGRLGSPEAAPLLERILLEPGFDAPGAKPFRDMAAWAARWIGGERMASTLRRSVERREGRDINVMVYLAQLQGPDSIPTLRSVRAPRFRHYDYHRSVEQERLDWMLRELSAGRSIRSLDIPPEELDLH